MILGKAGALLLITECAFKDFLCFFSQRLAEVYASVHYFEAEGLMAAQGCFVVNPCVRRYFEAALIAGPGLGGAHQGRTDSLLAGCFADEPAFDETDWTGGVAAVGVGAQADLDESGERSAFVLGDEDCHGESAAHAEAEGRFYVLAVFFG